MHPTAESFARRAADEHGFEVEVNEFPEGTKTAGDAADAIGCELGQIAKSIVMVADGEVVVVLTSGENRVDEDALADELGASDARTADADEVKDATGWSIGGVPPFCHDSDVRVLADPSLGRFERVWAAAGTPDAVFPIPPEELESLSGAERLDVFG